MEKSEKLLLNLFLLAIFFFKLPNFYIIPIQSVFFTGQAISRTIFILIFIIKITELFLSKRKIFQQSNQKLLPILITLFFFLQSLSIISVVNIISFLSRYKELIIGFICFFNFYFFQKEYKKIISVFLVSALINSLYQSLILFSDNQIINTISNLIYQKHWQMVAQQLSQGKLLIDTYDETILPFLFLFIKKDKSFKLFSSSILILIIGFFSFLSNSRSRILMFIIGFLGSLFFIKKINRKIILLLFLSLFFSTHILDFIGLNISRRSFVDRVFLMTEESKRTAIYRMDQIKSAINMGKSTIFGVGLGNYYDNLPAAEKLEKYLYPRRQTEYIGAIGAVEFVHNIFGLIIVENGYITLIIFIVILFFFIKNDLALLKKGDDYQISFVIMFWTLFALGLFNPIIPGSYNVLFWGIRGLLI